VRGVSIPVRVSRSASPRPRPKKGSQQYQSARSQAVNSGSPVHPCQDPPKCGGVPVHLKRGRKGKGRVAEAVSHRRATLGGEFGGFGVFEESRLRPGENPSGRVELAEEEKKRDASLLLYPRRGQLGKGGKGNFMPLECSGGPRGEKIGLLPSHLFIGEKNCPLSISPWCADGQ